MIVTGDALISDCGLYRYWLSRIWDEDLPILLWVLLNPSTADASKDDQTLRKGMGFARRWGYGGVIFVNLFAFRATKPADMKAAEDPVGPDNNKHLMDMACKTLGRVVYAWGRHGTHLGRDKEVVELLGSFNTWCLGKNKDGTPRHPLMLAYTTPLEGWL